MWKWGAQGHGVHFAERDAEPAGARNSASDRAKCGCGVGYGVLLELVLEVLLLMYVWFSFLNQLLFEKAEVQLKRFNFPVVDLKKQFFIV